MGTIEWRDVPKPGGGFKNGESWNPIRGCTAVSPACNSCYAESMAGRFDKPGLWGHGLTDLRANGERLWSGKVGPYQPRLGKPLHWKKPRGIFVNSTSDVWHEKMMSNVDGRSQYIAAMFGVMAATPQHTYMILTKRPHLMREWFERVRRSAVGSMCTIPELCRRNARSLLGEKYRRILAAGDTSWPLPNVWLGCTTENQECADRRIPDLLRTPAAVRFLSCEPLLGPVDLGRHLWQSGPSTSGPRGSGMGGQQITAHPRGDLHWVITGGESGRKARPSHPGWFRDIRDQCVDADVAYFHKQDGEWTKVTDDSWTHMVSKTTGKAYARGEDMPISEVASMGFVQRVGKKTAGRQLDGREWSEFPDV